MISEDHSEPERLLWAQVQREQRKVAATRTPLGPPPRGVEATSGQEPPIPAEKLPGSLPDGNHYARPLGRSWKVVIVNSNRSGEWKQVLPAKWPHGE